MYNRIRDLKKVEKREKYFSTLAEKEGKGAHERAVSEEKKGMKESAKDSRREEKIDFKFSDKREKIAGKAEKNISKLKK